MRLSRSPFLVSLLLAKSDCMRPEDMRSLNPVDSLRYINDEPGYREEVNSQQISASSNLVATFHQYWSRAAPSAVRFNLGEHFESYMMDVDFRERVLELVGDDRWRVWSDVDRLNLLPAEEEPIVLDMNDLTGLGNLLSLNVKISHVVNLSALGIITNLQQLSLHGVGVVDMKDLVLPESPEENMGALGLFMVMEGVISYLYTGELRINHFGRYVNLKSFNVYECQVENLAALGALSTLEFLRLEEVGALDISGLGRLVNLHGLEISETQVQGISQLARLETLQSLNLMNAGVIDMNELAGFDHLDTLIFQAANVENVHALGQLASLRILSLVTPDGDLDLSDLAGGRNLNYLKVGATNLQNVNALALLPNLGILYLYWYSPDGSINVTDLAGCRNLRELSLNVANLHNIAALAQLQNLQILDLHGWRVHDIRAFIQQAFIFPPAQVQPFVYPDEPILPPHAEIATVLPADENDRKCSICWNQVEHLNDCLVTCGQRKPFHRACLQNWSLTCEQSRTKADCPQCGLPLGPLP